MTDVGFLPAADRDAALAEVPGLKLSPVGSGCEDPAVTAPFFCAYVRDVLENTELGAVLGRTREERQQRLLGGGLTIRTTLDPRLQAAAQSAVDGAIPRDDPSEVATVMNMVEPGSGRVKAMAVNRSFAEEGLGNTKVNLAIGGSSGMQAGSTFKPFVLARALQMGIPLSLSIRSPQTYTSKVFTNFDKGRKVPYKLQNAGDSQAGTYDLESGTHGSVNTFYVQLQERTGVERPAALAESLGVKQFAGGRPQDPLLRGGAFTLGANEISPLAMAGAYATFAARGRFCPPNPIAEVIDANGQQVGLPAPPCQQVLEEDVADTVNQVLRGVIDGPSRGRTGKGASLGRPAAGKTGSTNGSKAAWFVGYTPELATAVWVGKPIPIEMKRIRIGGRYYPQVYGGTLPASIWQRGMREAVQGTPVTDFARPNRRDTRVPVPDVTGLPDEGRAPGAARRRLRRPGRRLRAGRRRGARRRGLHLPHRREPGRPGRHHHALPVQRPDAASRGGGGAARRGGADRPGAAGSGAGRSGPRRDRGAGPAGVAGQQRQRTGAQRRVGRAAPARSRDYSSSGRGISPVQAQGSSRSRSQAVSPLRIRYPRWSRSSWGSRSGSALSQAGVGVQTGPARVGRVGVQLLLEQGGG
jgi:membrane peptidoglycan carboxypeptidase